MKTMMTVNYNYYVTKIGNLLDCESSIIPNLYLCRSVKHCCRAIAATVSASCSATCTCTLRNYCCMMLISQL